MSTRLSKIDELTRPDHTFLEAADSCYYLGEYTSRAGYAFSETNDLIQNLKKPMDRKGTAQWKWKERAIERSAAMLREAIPEQWLTTVTFVPVPPSKTTTHPDYHDRLIQILKKMAEGTPLDVREIVTMTSSLEAAHLSDNPRSINNLVSHMRVDQSLSLPDPSAICIFDDVLTTGAHFKAVQTCLREHFPQTPMAGLFLARRTPDASPI